MTFDADETKDENETIEEAKPQEKPVKKRDMKLEGKNRNYKLLLDSRTVADEKAPVV